MAVNRPKDTASLEAAKKFELSRSPGSPFLAAAEIIFEEAGGDNAPSAEYAIRALLKKCAKDEAFGKGEQTNQLDSLIAYLASL